MQLGSTFSTTAPPSSNSGDNNILITNVQNQKYFCLHIDVEFKKLNLWVITEICCKTWTKYYNQNFTHSHFYFYPSISILYIYMYMHDIYFFGKTKYIFKGFINYLWILFGIWTLVEHTHFLSRDCLLWCMLGSWVLV